MCIHECLSVICGHAKSLEHCHYTFMKSNNLSNPLNHENPNSFLYHLFFLAFHFLIREGESIFAAESKIVI